MSAQPVAPFEPAVPSVPADLIAREVARAASRHLGGALRAVIQTGSLARGEGTFVRQGGRWQARSDAEFLVVLSDEAEWSGVAALETEAESALRDAGVQCRPEITATRAEYLRALRPHIFAYELKTCGRVLAGDPAILGLVPSFGPADIPREDGWRLLSNRMVEMLDWPDPAPRAGEPLPEAAAYRTVKLGLDAATSLLIFAGSYAPSYRARAESLHRLALKGAPEIPLPLPEFAAVVADLTHRKLDGEPAASRLDWELWRRVVSWSHALWLFELARLLGASDSEGADAEEFARRQPLAQKMRGWLYVWRTQGWLRGAAALPRIASRVGRGSPRYQVYRVAAELFAALPTLLPVSLQATKDDGRWSVLRTELPLSPLQPKGSSHETWQELATAVLWNYRRFLVKTRS